MAEYETVVGEWAVDGAKKVLGEVIVPGDQADGGDNSSEMPVLHANHRMNLVKEIWQGLFMDSLRRRTTGPIFPLDAEDATVISASSFL